MGILLLSSLVPGFTHAMNNSTTPHHQQETEKHEIPGYVSAFIELFKTDTINPHNFDQQIHSNVFNGPEFSNPMSLPMKELHALASLSEHSGIKDSVFHLLNELETQQPGQIHHNDNKKKFFIINHLLGNPETITISKKYVEQFMTGQFGQDHNFAIYAYVLLDSGTGEEQALALKCLKSIINNPAGETAAPLILKLLFSAKDQAKVSSFINDIVKKLPVYRQNNPWGALQVASVLFGHRDYHQNAIEFIENSLQLKEIHGQSPFAVVVQALLQSPETKDYATHLLEERVLPNPNIKAKDKWMIVQNLLWQDKPKAMGYLDTIWKVNHSNQDHAQLLFEAMNHLDLQDFLLPKIMEKFDIMLAMPKTMPEHEVGMNFDRLVHFLSSLDHGHLGRIQDNIKSLVHVIFHLPKNALPGIQANEVLNLLQKSGLDAKDTLLVYSESTTIAPQFFINLCQNMPEKEHFLLMVYKGQKTNPLLKTKILTEFLRDIEWNHNLQRILNKDELLQDLHEQFKQSNNINQKSELFQAIAYSSTINKQSRNFEGMLNELLLETRNPNIPLHIRYQILTTLKSKNLPSLQLQAVLGMIENLNNLEEKIKNKAFDMYTDVSGSTIYSVHATPAIQKLKSTVDHLLEDFHSYHFQGVPFDQKALIEKTRAILANHALMKETLGGLGAEMEKYVEEAKENLSVLESELVWNEPNSELESTQIDGKTITAGQIYSLFLYYIERQKGKPSYISLIGGLVQALASSEAMKGCRTGSMSGIGNTTFKDEFKKEGQKETRSFENYTGVVSNKLIRLKTIMIYLLSHYKPGTNIFDIHHDLINKLLVKEFDDHDIESNEFLIETFQIFNQTLLEHIFGDSIHRVAEIFTKASDHKFHPTLEEKKLMKDVHTLIINPAILALLSKEYSDFVVFTPHMRDGAKLSYPDYVGFIEEDIPYEPTLISSINHAVAYHCPEPAVIQQLNGSGTLTAISSNGTAFTGHNHSHITLPSVQEGKLIQVSLENHTKMMCSYEPVNSGVFTLETTIHGNCNIPDGHVVPNISFHNVYKLCNSPETCVVSCQ